MGNKFYQIDIKLDSKQKERRKIFSLGIWDILQPILKIFPFLTYLLEDHEEKKNENNELREDEPLSSNGLDSSNKDLCEEIVQETQTSNIYSRKDCSEDNPAPESDSDSYMIMSERSDTQNDSREDVFIDVMISNMKACYENVEDDESSDFKEKSSSGQDQNDESNEEYSVASSSLESSNITDPTNILISRVTKVQETEKLYTNKYRKDEQLEIDEVDGVDLDMVWTPSLTIMAKNDNTQLQKRLGTALDVTGGIVGVVGGMLPGSGLVSAGLQMGGTILKKRAEKAEAKIAKKLDDTIASLSEDQTFLRDELLELRKNVKEREMKTDWEAIQQDLMGIIEEVKISHSKTTSELSTLTSLVEKTFDLVVELRFKVWFWTI